MNAKPRIGSRRKHAVLLALASIALAACSDGGGGETAGPSGPPVITLASGTFNHKSSVTITGSGFGVKSPAAPAVWDDASGTNILSKWSDAWPSQNPTYNTAYRPPQRGIGLPHTRITKYIAGAHYSSDGADAGFNVMFWKDRTISSYPAYTYISWYQRVDDGWTFQDDSGCGGDPTCLVDNDNNFKVFAFSACCTPYEFPNNWYIEYHPRPTSAAATPGWHMADDNTTSPSLDNPDENGHGLFWESAINPMAGAWVKIEVAVKYTRGRDGYIKLWEDGVLKIDYAGPTDKYAGTTRTEGIGGYARSRSTNNWRYFADVYLDYTRAGVVLANNASLSLATIIENQIPTGWSDTSINFTVNLGQFATGQTAYLFVVNPSGQLSDPGHRLTIP